MTAKSQSTNIRLRSIRQEDFFWLRTYDFSPLSMERDSIYLFFCVHFSDTSFVAFDTLNDQPVGVVLGFLPAGKSIAYVHYLFVDEGYRRQGIGSRLMESFIDAVRLQGAKDVTLFTVRAVDFYQRLGFEIGNVAFDGVVSDYIGDAKRASIMRLKL